MRATPNRRAGSFAVGGSVIALAAMLLPGAGAAAQTPVVEGQSGQTRPADIGSKAARPDDQAAAQNSDIVVTGSRITRTGFDQPTPTTVLSDTELRQAARPNIQQVLNDQPQFRATVTPSVSNGNTATGTAPVDLRGLGTNRTLTLLNGRRFAGSNNLNFIPAGLVDRVEVVTGGASAAYGSDAIAGVVNIILKKDLEGLNVGALGGVSSRGDAQRRGVDGSFGTSFAGGNGHVLIGAEYINDKGIPDRNARKNLGSAGIVRVNPTSTTDLSTVLVRDVNFGNQTRDGLITSGIFAGQVFNSDGTLRAFQRGTPIGAAAFPAQMIGGADGVGLYDDVGAATPFKRLSAYARVSYDIGQATVWADGTYGRTTSNAKFLPDYVVPAVTVSATNPFLSQTIRNQLAAAGQTSFTLGRLFDDVFELQFDVKRTNKEGAVGIDGGFGEKWKYHAYYDHGEVYQNQQIKNSRIADNYTRAINAVTASNGQIVCAVNADAITTNDDPNCAPLNPFGRGNASAAALNYVRGTQQTFITNKLDAAAADIQGDLFNLWAGPLTVDIGIEGRWTSQKQTRGAQSQITPAIFGPLTVYTSDVSGKINVKEAFGEVALPVLNIAGTAKIDLNGAARYSDYSTSGGIWSWKAGGTARLFDSLLLRATRSRDIRSANVSELFSVRSINIGPLVDQDRAGRSANAGYNPSPSTVTTFTGGNPNLKPEIAQTLTVGGSYQPTFFRGLNLSVDYYRIKVNGYVTTLTGTLLTLSCSQGNSAACAAVTRDATGTVTTVNAAFQNIANLKTQGLDFEASYVLPVSQIASSLTGSLRLRALATYIKHFTFNNSLTVVDSAGDVGDSVSNANPKWRGTFSASYQSDVIGLDARVRYVDGGRYNQLATTLVNNSIKSRTYLDLGVQFKIAKRFTLFGNVNNVLDRDPPILTTGSPFYDILGRYFTAGARVNF